MERSLHGALGDQAVNFWRWLNRSPAPSVPDVPDLRAAVDARHASTSKNIQNRPGPEAKYPSRPASSPHVDQMARDKFGVELVDPPPTNDQLVAAIREIRG
jgi:hypothetical protein